MSIAGYLNFKVTDIIYDEQYKYSKDELTADFIKSVAENDLFEPVILFKENDKVRIIAGHNRYKASLQTEKQYIKAVVTELPDFDFKQHVFWRNYNSRISSVKKIKFIFDFPNNDEFFLKKIGVPVSFQNAETCRKVLSLPENIRSYLDVKDINFRTIEKILTLDANYISLLSKLIVSSQIRVNVFREIVSLTSDFCRFNQVFDFNTPVAESLKIYEDEILRQMRNLRYPKYSTSLVRSEDIISKYRNIGIDIAVPEFFEGNSVSFSFKIQKISDIDKKIAALKNIDKNDLNELLNLL